MLVLDQTTDKDKASGVPVHISHPLNARPLFHPQLGWVPSITTVPHPSRGVGGGAWNFGSGWDLIRGIINPYFSDASFLPPPRFFCLCSVYLIMLPNKSLQSRKERFQKNDR